MGEEEKPVKIQNFFYSCLKKDHFELRKLEEKNGGVLKTFATCLLCATPKEITGDTTSNGNFFKHLKTCHQLIYDQDYGTPESRRKRKKSDDGSSNSLATDVPTGNQQNVDKCIIRYIVKGMKPLSTVTCPHFRNMIQAVAGDRDIHLMGRRELSTKLDELYDDTIHRTTEVLRKNRYICLTADLWTSSHRSFLGVTAHWINKNLQRNSAILACVRFKGVHSYDRISLMLRDVMNRYELSVNKITHVVTDNGSNFVKAFKEFGLENIDDYFCGITWTNEYEKENATDSEASDEDEFSFNETDELQEVSTLDILDENQLYQDFVLPPHFRCSSHTLSLIATKDFQKIPEKRLYKAAMEKCTKLWNLSGKSKNAEAIKTKCGRMLVTPNATRWNSLFRSIDSLLEIKEHLSCILEHLGISDFTKRELQFLTEYSMVTSPLAKCLDKLQGEQFVFLGDLLPALHLLKKKTEAAKANVKLASSFANKIIESINVRFEKVMDIDLESEIKEPLLAALSHPFHKVNWLPEEMHATLKEKFAQKCIAHVQITAEQSISASQVNRRSITGDDYFDYSEPVVNPNISQIRQQCFAFFQNEDTSLMILEEYPHVKEMFLRFNTTLPSSAPVERLFSYAGLVLSPRRRNLKDSTFEKLVLLKCNNLFD